MEERLQKILSAAGVASRRRSEQLITEGRIAVNGVTADRLGIKADPDKDTITVDGKPVLMPGVKYYILLNKPAGYTSTSFDPYAKKTVMDLVTDVGAPLHTVGRLDVDTEGLLILTTDGDFTQKLTHPSYEVPKTYRVTVRGVPNERGLERLSKGIRLEDGVTAPAKTRLVKVESGKRTSLIEITIHEGRKRQIKRMFEVIGHKVEHLVRSKIAGIQIEDLPLGKWRHLTEKEVQALLRSAQKEQKKMENQHP
ncbi:MAG: rRNA pseudouridine synthase [Lentisphaerae bacterium]|nr:rRNA pseudouridine synthase [Lentisphaerota bacterium]